VPASKAKSCGEMVALVLELDMWEAKRDALHRPDRIIMDLDPDPTVPWKDVIDAAQVVKKLINELALDCFVKTTGGKGFHVLLPLQRVHTWVCRTMNP
jgi:bifunctional non-homologous end joining protein LigD